jgi:hypothetical protein
MDCDEMKNLLSTMKYLDASMAMLAANAHEHTRRTAVMHSKTQAYASDNSSSAGAHFGKSPWLGAEYTV